MSASPSHPIVAEILRDFLAGVLSFEAFERQMRPYVTMDVGSYVRAIHYRQPIDVSVRVHPRDLYPVIEAYLTGERSAAELSRWAEVLDLMPEYGPGAEVSDAEADRL